MTEVSLYGEPVKTIFELLPSLGTIEDDISRAVGFTMSRCPSLLRSFIRFTTGEVPPSEVDAIRLQTIIPRAGRTDLEVEADGKLHIIVEAKREWQLPDVRQLMQYAKRLTGSKAGTKRIVALTDCSPEYAVTHLQRHEILGIPICHVSWAQFAQLASDSRPECAFAERYAIDELLEYLKGVITMQRADSNWVYVLALAGGQPEGWKISWIDIVKEKRRYFHPVGVNGWPAAPPNYMAFRYNGELQSIHHVEGYDVVEDVHDGMPEIPRGEVTGSFFLYRLGRPFRPDHQVKTGNIYASGRRWCMLDTLFTSPTIADACTASKKREESAPEFAPLSMRAKAGK